MALICPFTSSLASLVGILPFSRERIVAFGTSAKPESLSTAKGGCVAIRNEVKMAGLSSTVLIVMWLKLSVNSMASSTLSRALSLASLYALGAKF